jgi:hypothetical protein
MRVSCPEARLGWVLCRLLMRVPQLSVKARLAHSACCAAIALRKTVTTGWTIENRAGHCVGIGDGYYFCPAPNTLLTDDLVTPDAESGHSPPHRAGRAGVTLATVTNFFRNRYRATLSHCSHARRWFCRAI